MSESRRTSTAREPSVLIVGPGSFFRSGITYYTFELCNALAERGETSAILLRRLLPEGLYPGKARIGVDLSDLDLDDRVDHFDGVDWYWVPSLLEALAFLRSRRPEVIVFEWWTSTALHTYLALAVAARALGSHVVIEFHEALDTAEAKITPVRIYAKAVAPLLFSLASRYVVHSTFDRDLVERTFRLPDRPFSLIPHAAYSHYVTGRPTRSAPASAHNILYFGVIRPFKGVEDLIAAFGLLSDDDVGDYWLTIVGEPWEGWDLPRQLAETSPHRDRISFIDRYVTDVEVDAFFVGSDVVVLPYHRSSQSGPLHVAFAYGLPVVVTRVGGLVEAAGPYEGTIFANPHDPQSLLDGIRESRSQEGRRFANPVTWERTAELYRSAFAAVEATRFRDAAIPRGRRVIASGRRLSRRAWARFVR